MKRRPHRTVKQDSFRNIIKDRTSSTTLGAIKKQMTLKNDDLVARHHKTIFLFLHRFCGRCGGRYSKLLEVPQILIFFSLRCQKRYVTSNDYTNFSFFFFVCVEIYGSATRLGGPSSELWRGWAGRLLSTPFYMSRLGGTSPLIFIDLI